MKKLTVLETKEIIGGRRVTCPICGYSKNVSWWQFWNWTLNETSLAEAHRGRRGNRNVH